MELTQFKMVHLVVQVVAVAINLEFMEQVAQVQQTKVMQVELQVAQPIEWVMAVVLVQLV